MSADNMPPLPKPAAWNCYWRGDNDSSSWDQWHDASDPLPAQWDGDPPDEVTPHYTADQMRAYARTYAAEQVRELVRELESVVSWMDAPDESAFSDTQLAALRALIAKHKGQA